MWSRRQFLLGAGGAAGAGVLAACGAGAPPAPVGPVPGPVGPGAAQVATVAAAQRRPGAPIRAYSLTAAPRQVDLGGPVVATWGYGPETPGPLLRATAGDTVRVNIDNQLPQPTTVHWHGLAIRNDMDGVDGLTQAAIAPDGTYPYEFSPPNPGTYWYHSHVGTQLDRALHGPLIVDDPAEPGGYDVEFVVVLDDWLDGVNGASPDQQLQTLLTGGMSMDANSGPSGPLGADTGDVAYPYYLINGRIPDAPVTLTARSGQRARIRLINAAADTPFRVALEGHPLTITHTDGYPVVPTTVDTLIVAMGERYDLLTTLGDGAFAFVAAAEGKTQGARAVVRTSPRAAPPPGRGRP